MIQFLQLMQLSDSALPIGAAAHSFGLEGLAEWGMVEAESLELMMRSYVYGQGMLEACFCRAAYNACREGENPAMLCRMLSARKTARESRDASAVLGRRLLGLCSSILPDEKAEHLFEVFRDADTHHAIAFGYLSALLEFDEDHAVAAFLHQSLSALVSAAQRLMPVGQKQAVAALWFIKDHLVNVARESRLHDYRTVGSFMPLMEVASMRHPLLETRLFLS